MLKFQNISWDDFRVLLSVASERSVRSAAARLGISPSTMSRRIASLEQQIGGKLVVRTGDGVELTSLGFHAHAIATNMEKSFLKVSQIADVVKSERGSVHCAVSEGLGTYWILPRLHRFQDAHPNTTIRMTCGLASTDVMRLEADLAIEYTPPVHPELICVKLATIHFCFHASQAYLRRAGAPRSIDDLAHHTIIEQVSNQARSGFLCDELRSLSLTERIAFVTNASATHRNAVECGLGIGVLPTYTSLLSADIEALDLDFQFSVQAWLIYHPDHRDNVKVMAFVAWLRSLFDPALHPCFAETFIKPQDLRRMAARPAPDPINTVAPDGRVPPATY